MQDMNERLEKLSEPSEQLVADMAAVKGDILFLGAGGKIGPSLALLCRKALDRAGISKRIIAVSRFSDPEARKELESEQIEIHPADLLDEKALQSLPEAENIIYLAGTKFGTSGHESFTWAMNTYLPGRVAERYKRSRIIVYSTGNVYPFVPVFSGGALEQTSPAPVGEYGQSCLGRERIFQHFSEKYGTPILIYRLNYANDLRYGVLLEIARSVKNGIPVDLNTGHANVIWQGDANEIALRSLLHCSTPAKILNVTGPETASVRWIAEEFGKIFQTTPQFTGEEQPLALLSNAAECFKMFGYPKVTLKEMIELTAAWLLEDGRTIDKPTHFQERKGNY